MSKANTTGPAHRFTIRANSEAVAWTEEPMIAAIIVAGLASNVADVDVFDEHGSMLWWEGQESQPASESFDEVCATIQGRERVLAMRRLAKGAQS